jgi:hypothetical protein
MAAIGYTLPPGPPKTASVLTLDLDITSQWTPLVLKRRISLKRKKGNGFMAEQRVQRRLAAILAADVVG